MASDAALAKPRLRAGRVAPQLPSSSQVRTYGPFALGIYLLATTRWGSYVLPGPPYISDIVIGLLIGERIVAATRRRLALGAIELTTGVTCGILLAWTGIRFAFGGDSLNALRDIASYAYAVLVFLTPARPWTDRERQRMEKVLWAGLMFHAAWITLGRIAPSTVASLPALGGGQSALFQGRPDVDATITGLTCVLALNRLASGRMQGVSLLVAAWSAALTLSAHSRAAIAASVVELLIFLLWTPAPRRVVRRYGPRYLIVVLLLAVPALGYGISTSNAVQRLGQATGSFLPFVPSHGDPTSSTTGTARARRRAWQAIEVYLEAKTSRALFGVGFGPDFLHASGGDVLLLGGTNEDVRQPHNYLINSWARIGLVGLAIVSAMLMAGLRLAYRLGRLHSGDELDLAAIILVTGLPVAATYGVVMESPFGAVPYFWALGYLGFRALELRRAVALR
ncbi:MAG: O-antigen ligase family protein [Solirubrobacteraceae bacterium]